MAKNNLWDYPHIISIIANELFHDLNEYTNERNIYERFFIERTSNARDLYASILNLEESHSPRNIFLLGDRGVGKSTFLKWFFTHPKYFLNRGTSAYLLDLRNISETNDDDSLVMITQVQIILAIKRYLQDTYDNPTNNELPNIEKIESDSQANILFNKACQILKNYDSSTNDFLTLFIDDIDYADKHIPKLIRGVRSLLPLHNCHCIFAGRPAAYNSIITGSPDNFGGAVFGRDNPIIRLSHLTVEDVLYARLNVICPEQPTIIKKQIKKWGKITPPVIMRELRNLFQDSSVPKNLNTIKYPFTMKQHNSTQYISNGNISYMLEIAKEYLIYMSQHSDEIVEDEIGYHIGRSAFISHFQSDSVKDIIRIQNLNAVKSYQFTSSEELKEKKTPKESIDNSLYICILESILDFESYDVSIEYLKIMGFDQLAIERGIGRLLDMQMLEESQIIDRRPLTLSGISDGPDIVKDYKITLRGKFYVSHLVHWSEYIGDPGKYGISNHHQKGLDIIAVETIRYYLTALAYSILISRQQQGISTDQFKVAKTEFWQFFMNYTEDIRVQLDRTTQNRPIPLIASDVEKYLRSLGIVEIPRLLRTNRYLFTNTKILSVAKTKSIPENLAYPFDTTELIEFVKQYVQAPGDEEE